MAVFGNLQEAVQELKRAPELPVRVRVDDLEIELRVLIPVEKLPKEGVQRVVSEGAEQDQLWERLWQAVGTCHDPEGAEGFDGHFRDQGFRVLPEDS
jgi:hypothetical protein